MRIKVGGDRGERIDGNRPYIERRLRFSLGRFEERIRLITVRVLPGDGPEGDAVHRCQVAVDLIPSGRVVVEGTESELLTAVDWVAERTGQAVGRELARRGEREGMGCG